MVFTQATIMIHNRRDDWLHEAEKAINADLRKFGLSLTGSPTLVDSTASTVTLRWEVMSDWS